MQARAAIEKNKVKFDQKLNEILQKHTAELQS